MIKPLAEMSDWPHGLKGSGMAGRELRLKYDLKPRFNHLNNGSNKRRDVRAGN